MVAAAPATPWTVSAAGLAKLLGVSVRSIRSWDQSGDIPAPIRIGGRVLWRADEIREWLDAGSPERLEWNAMRKAKRR